VTRRHLVLALFLLALGTACGESGDDAEVGPTATAAKPMLQPDGPLRGLALVGEASDDGSYSDPQLSFTTEDTQATAVVGLGDDVPEESTLTVAWYRLVGLDGRQHLFSHQIVVGPGGQAFSQGVAQAGLAPGVYETVATLGERQVRTPWVVRVATDVASLGGAFAFLSRSGLAQAGDEDWNVPESGDSSWYDPETTAANPPPPGPCEVAAVRPGFSPLTGVTASVYWVGLCARMTLAATVSGAPQEVASKEITEESRASLSGEAELCELPGGSDLPGTVVQWTATGSERATGSQSITVPDFGETLEAIVQAAENTPSRVNPGYRIELRGVGLVMPPALGIKELSLYAGDELIQTVGNASRTSAPQPCDFGRYGAVNRASYTVPNAPSPVIKICAEALGFDGTEASGCIEFFTGEVWEGTANSTVTTQHAGQCGNPTTTQATVRLVVAEDGAVTGTYDVTGCGVSEPHAEWTGTMTDAGFLFPQLVVFTNGSLIPKVSPTHAEATLTNLQGPAELPTTWVTTWDLKCKSCEE